MAQAKIQIPSYLKALQISARALYNVPFKPLVQFEPGSLQVQVRQASRKTLFNPGTRLALAV